MYSLKEFVYHIYFPCLFFLYGHYYTMVFSGSSITFLEFSFIRRGLFSTLKFLPFSQIQLFTTSFTIYISSFFVYFHPVFVNSIFFTWLLVCCFFRNVFFSPSSRIYLTLYKNEIKRSFLAILTTILYTLKLTLSCCIFLPKVKERDSITHTIL